MSQLEPVPAVRGRYPAWLAPLFLAGLVWFSHFYWHSKFGLYEDDYVLIEVPMNSWLLPQLQEAHLHSCGTYLQGRPLHFVIGHTLAYVTTKPGGTLGTAYVAAFAIQVINAWLVLLLARRAIGPRNAPLAAAVFALAPADTTHQFLHACFCVLPSVTFMLLSLLAYQRGWRFLSYLPGALTLITYETCFLPLLLAPFLATEAPRVRRFLLHSAILGTILVGAFALRTHVGEARVSEELSDRSAMLSKAFRLATVGPATSAKAFVLKPESAFERLSDPKYFTGDGMKPLAGAWAIVAAVSFGVVLLASGRGSPEHAARRQLTRVALAASAMIVLAYPAALSRNPIEVEGRMSSIHIAAAPGWALFAGAVMGLALSALPQTGRRVLWALAAAHVGALAAYHVTVQRDYVVGWAEQRRFWGELNRLTPDKDDDTIILYPFPKQACKAVEVHSHFDYMLPQRMFYKLPRWKNPPLAVHVGIHIAGLVPHDYAGYEWREVQVENGELVFMHWSGRKLPMRPGTVIALYPDGNGHWHRVTGPLEIHGVRLPLRAPDSPPPKALPTFLRWQLTPP